MTLTSVFNNDCFWYFSKYDCINTALQYTVYTKLTSE